MAENTDPMPADPEEFSEDDEDEDDEHEWLLGFVEPPISRQSLLRHRFPSKVGGRPAWLDPVRLPSLTQLAGPDGATPLSFLLQVYAPVETDPAAFHRTVFVFMHPDAAVLLRPGGVKVLRGQLPLRNPYYGEAPASEEEGAPRPAGEPAGPDPWAVAQYERAWKVPGKAERPCPFLFPEAELVVEEERRSVDPEEEARELQRLMRQANIQEADGTADDEPGVMEGVEAQITDEQRDFAAFSARIAIEPAQCLRYCFEPKAAPLWPSRKNTVSEAEIPPCTNCGAPRRFEFQVMPQMLTHLGIDDTRVDAPDWAMLAVYSCSASCSVDAATPSAYVEEFAWVQPPLR